LGAESLVYTLPDTSLPRVAVQLWPDTWEVRMTQDSLTIGRAKTCDVVLDHPKVSREHAKLEQRGDRTWVRDLGSTNGTWIGGRRISEQMVDTGTEFRIGPAVLVYKAAFGPDDLTVVGQAKKRTPDRPLRRLPVVFVPGFMGAEMWSNGRKLWPNVHAALANPEIFSWPDKQLDPRSILHEHVIIPNFISLARYSRLVDYLEEDLGYKRGEDLLEFPYDWRQDNRISARQLGERIHEWRSAKGHRDVAIIAHSMGCLISRYYVERLGGKEHVARLALVGGLNGGSPKTFQAFLGAKGILAFNQIRARFQRVVAQFPSVYQSLPNYTCVTDSKGDAIDFFAQDEWLPEENRPLLRDGAAFFSELGVTTSVPTVCVFGYGLKTPVRLVVDRDDDGAWVGTKMEVADRGDDTIPQESAVLEGAEIHPVRQHHGVLYTDADVRMRLRLELLGGGGV
jgi:pimeloyl-ACP methyl ester carboxylesterase